MTLYRMTVMYNIVRDRIHALILYSFTMRYSYDHRRTYAIHNYTDTFTACTQACGSTTYRTLSTPHAEAEFLDVIGTKV